MTGVWLAHQRALAPVVLALLSVLVFAGGSPPLFAASAGCASLPHGCPKAEVLARQDYLAEAGERWLEVDLDTHEVVLRSGFQVLLRVPVATGRNDTPWTTTYPGLFRVYRKVRDLTYLPEQGIYIRDWVAFDPVWHNGFHSLPLDERGFVLDDRVGQAITNGCVRTPASDTIYRFARVGTRVLVRAGSDAFREIRLTPLRWLRGAL